MKDVERLNIRDIEGGAILVVKVVPGSSRDRIAGVLGDALKITTAAAPEKGKANLTVANTLARALGVGRGDIELLSGASSPRKEFCVTGTSKQMLRDILEGITP